MADIAHTLQQGLSERGWRVTVISTDPLSARLVATDTDGAACEVDILKGNLWSPPRDTKYGPPSTTSSAPKSAPWPTAALSGTSSTSTPPPNTTPARNSNNSANATDATPSAS